MQNNVNNYNKQQEKQQIHFRFLLLFSAQHEELKESFKRDNHMEQLLLLPVVVGVVVVVASCYSCLLLLLIYSFHFAHSLCSLLDVVKGNVNSVARLPKKQQQQQRNTMQHETFAASAASMCVISAVPGGKAEGGGAADVVNLSAR